MKATRVWAIILLLVAAQGIGSYFQDGTDGPVDRRPPIHFDPETGPALPPPSPRDPVLVVEEGRRANSVGSAVAITDDGVWVTARHVVDGCDKVGIMTGSRRAEAARRVQIHPRADIAILWTRRAAPAMSISTSPLHINQAGFHFGYPSGRPGQAVSKLIGRKTVRGVGRRRYSEPAIAWAEVARFPGTKSLGGISGGPVVDRSGRIVGITVAESERRGRIVTTDPSSLTYLLSSASIQPNGQPSARLNDAGPTPENYVDYGTALRRQLTVAQVICRVFDDRGSG